jgi:hypothetical protein
MVGKKKEEVVKQSKRAMVLAGNTFQEIQNVYKSVKKEEIGFLCLKLGKPIVEGLDVSDCYVNPKGAIVISGSVIEGSGFSVNDSFSVEPNKKDGTIILTFTENIYREPKETKKQKETRLQKEQEEE